MLRAERSRYENGGDVNMRLRIFGPENVILVDTIVPPGKVYLSNDDTDSKSIRFTWSKIA